MRLYHGSYCKIIDIDLTKCRKYKDFGVGFYLTADFGRAVTMANRSVILNNTGNPEVNSFLFYKSRCPSNLKIKEFRTNDWEWAKFVMQNRDKSLDPPFEHEFDIIIGSVADSSVDPEIQKYKNNFGEDYLLPQNLKILAQKLKYQGNYIQYCFCTEYAIKQLRKE